MKRNSQIERVSQLAVLAVLAIAAVFLLWSARGTDAPVRSDKILVADSLDTERQLIEVRADSLVKLLQRIKNNNADIFTFTLSEQTLIISCLPERQVAFNQLFLNDASLSAYTRIENTQLTIDTEGYSFSVPVHAFQGVAFIELPVDIVQSILLSQES
ncbi:hypothetical protein [Persicitalea jodogahamensis]|uniref:Uncharacterized protein n=1 Tax=Persicitalea jodogahamensis TaxID=402147 RepID=A0A8J3DG79_9BACT|nr:hypothetical protein [Persicitalea jodogahamensis]GHB88813.1 hypothetical protein GCM10007390_51140 [Persicitalea jodogahamensis]